jgi:hypothetical protein
MEGKRGDPSRAAAKELAEAIVMRAYIARWEVSLSIAETEIGPPASNSSPQLRAVGLAESSSWSDNNVHVKFCSDDLSVSALFIADCESKIIVPSEVTRGHV